MGLARSRAPSCLPRTLRVGKKGIGRVRLGDRQTTVIRRIGRPTRRKRLALRYCVRGGGRVLIAFNRRGRASLIVSTARGHKARGFSRGASSRLVRRFYPTPRRVRPSLYLVTRRSTRVLLGMKGNRARFVGVADRRLLRAGRGLRKALRQLGL